MDILYSQALWTLGLIDKGRLPDVANEALVDGLDSSSLRILASLSQIEHEQAPDLFIFSLKELKYQPLSRLEAARICAIFISKQIIHGDVSPIEGANKLWDVSILVDDLDFHELDTFVYAASELQSRPEDKDFFIEKIMSEAAIWSSKMDL